MKKFQNLVGLLIVGSLAFTTKTTAQIIVTDADMPVAGNSFVTGHDSTSAQLTTYSPLAKGANVTWDFHTVPLVYNSTSIFAAPNNTPYGSYHTSSNLADTTIGIAGYTFLSSTSSVFSVTGLEQKVLGHMVAVIFNKPIVQLKFPAQFGNTDSGYCTAKVPPVVFNTIPPYDSAKGNVYVTYADTIDAWGSVTTPLMNGSSYSTYSVLREKHYEVDIDSIFLHDPTGGWTYFAYGNPKTITYEYKWYTNSANGAEVASMLMDTNNKYVAAITWYNGLPNGVNEISQTHNTLVYPNPATNQISFRYSAQNAQNIFVYDITGRVIGQTEMKNGMATLNTSAFASGIYFYHVTDKSGNMLDNGKFSVL
jgi:hypothetical protein